MLQGRGMDLVCCLFYCLLSTKQLWWKLIPSPLLLFPPSSFFFKYTSSQFFLKQGCQLFLPIYLMNQDSIGYARFQIPKVIPLMQFKPLNIHCTYVNSYKNTFIVIAACLLHLAKFIVILHLMSSLPHQILYLAECSKLQPVMLCNI